MSLISWITNKNLSFRIFRSNFHLFCKSAVAFDFSVLPEYEGPLPGY